MTGLQKYACVCDRRGDETPWRILAERMICVSVLRNVDVDASRDLQDPFYLYLGDAVVSRPRLVYFCEAVFHHALSVGSNVLRPRIPRDPISVICFYDENSSPRSSLNVLVQISYTGHLDPC